MKRNNLNGQKFGRLTVLELAGMKGGGSLWRCRCDCGQEKIVEGYNLKNGNSQSCGCLRREIASRNGKKVGPKRLRHGHAKRIQRSSTYKSWDAMRQRCSNPKLPFFKNYGGRGIRVCERWMKFENFVADIGERPAGLTLDRINNDGNYEPGNCKWSNRKEQNNNQRPRKEN